MNWFRFKSIRTKMTFWFFVIASIPLIIISFTSYSQRVNTIELQTFEKLSAIRDLKVEQVKAWVTERIGDTQTMSGDFEIRGLKYSLNKRSRSPEDKKKIEIATQLLKRNLKNFSDYEEIFIVGVESGTVEISTNRVSIGKNKSRDLYYTTPLQTGEVFIKDIYRSVTASRPQMTISIPVFSLEHESDIIGILVVRIDLSNSLYKLLLNRVGLGETGETLIVNKDILALNQLRWYDNAPLNLHISAIPAINASQGKTGVINSNDYRDIMVLAAYTFIPETGWGFVCKQDLYELNEPIRGMIRDYIITAVISFLILFLISLFVSGTISKPILEAKKVTSGIIAGDLSLRNVISSSDEIGSLASAINEMTETIESRINIQDEVGKINTLMVGLSYMKEFASGLLEHLMGTTKANIGTFYILNEVTSEYEHFVSVGASKKLFNPFNADEPEGEFGYPITYKQISYLRDIPEESIFKFPTIAGDIKPKEIITIPILIEDQVIALISLANIHRFDKISYDILKESWMNINSSYSSILVNQRTQILAENLSRTNQQLEAQAEELQEQTEEMQSQAEELHITTKELHEQNLELDMQKNEVEEANRLKSQFLSNMSHELRTPLNSIMALSHVLIQQAGEKLSEEENSYLEIVERNGKILLTLINDILDLSKIEAGKIDIKPAFISLRELLESDIENLSPLAEKKDLTINLLIPDDLPEVETDRDKYSQVLLNIIGNSIKFTEKGEVNIRASHDPLYVYIDIEDTGIGISEENLQIIFEEFRQVDGSSKRNYEGTGLGLAISSKLMKLLGGTISVKSEAGKGSIFTLALPIKWQGESMAGKGDSLLTYDDPDKTGNISGSVKDFREISGQRILIVEDNEIAILQVKKMLESEGYLVDVAVGGAQALEYMEHSIPDGIIMDLMMPGIDGFEVLEKIRSKKSTKNIPVLILTAKDLNKKDLAKLSSNNIHHLINKGDVDRDEFLSKIAIMLNINDKRADKTEKKVNKVKNVVTKGRSNMIISKTPGLPTILIIEDNPDNMVTINAILKNNYNTLEAYDGEEGLVLVNSQNPDLILLDISLPGMDGIEVLSSLKSSVETSGIPVIAITARVMQEDLELLSESGFNDFISKPVDPDEVLKKLKIWIK